MSPRKQRAHYAEDFVLLGRHLREQMRISGRCRITTAAQSGLSLGTINAIALGHTVPRLDTLLVLSAALHLDLESLLSPVLDRQAKHRRAAVRRLRRRTADEKNLNIESKALSNLNTPEA